MGVLAFQLGKRCETAIFSVYVLLEVAKLVEKLRPLVLGLQDSSGRVAYSECTVFVHSGIASAHKTHLILVADTPNEGIKNMSCDAQVYTGWQFAFVHLPRRIVHGIDD